MAIDLDGPNSAINVNTVETYSGSTLTLGKSGDTITLGSGVTTSGFQKDGAIAWDSSIKSANTSITTGTGFFVDTTSAAITITLPASPSVGDIVGLKDYAGTFGTNNLTIARNGSNIQGNANDSLISTNRASVVLVYADATRGWLYTVESNVSDFGPLFTATGGTITTSGDFKIHTFTSSGTFTVTSTSPTSNTVDYLVIAGGAGGGGGIAGGGGAGGYRESFPNPATGGFPVSAQAYPITVGGGGTAGPDGTPNGGPGSNSVFSTITSAGGGGGGGVGQTGLNGGSGGGGSGNNGSAGGSGNTPSVSPPQGNNGGAGETNGSPSGDFSGGGGGAGAVGTDGNEPGRTGGPGGNGSASSITGSSVTRGGGGGGASRGGPGPSGAGGSGGGGQAGGGDTAQTAAAGTANTGGGGGGGGWPQPTYPSAAGGSGVVIIRYKFK